MNLAKRGRIDRVLEKALGTPHPAEVLLPPRSKKTSVVAHRFSLKAFDPGSDMSLYDRPKRVVADRKRLPKKDLQKPIVKEQTILAKMNEKKPDEPVAHRSANDWEERFMPLHFIS